MDAWEKFIKLLQLGIDFFNQQQYTKAEKLFRAALELAKLINDQLLQTKAMFLGQYWLAESLRMQGKYQDAFPWYTELITYINKPLSENEHQYVASSFIYFVEVGSSLPDIKIVSLEQSLNLGLNWLKSIGKQEWLAGLHLQKGSLWQKQGRKEEALEEFEIALAMARRQSDRSAAPGYGLAYYLYRLGCLLRQMNKLEEAQKYHQEVINGYRFNKHTKQQSWGELAYIALARKDLPAAEAAAQKALELAQDIESPIPRCLTHNLLGEIYWEKNQISKVIEAKIHAWRYVRRWGNLSWSYSIYTYLAEIRLYQAQQDPLRYIPKAQRWLRWATPLAERLDQQEGTNKRQQSIQETQAVYEQALALWSGASQVTKQNRAYDYQGNKPIDLSATAYLAYLYETYLLTAEIYIESAYLGNPQEHIPKVLHNCQLALPIARQLDAQEKTTFRQLEIQAIQAECQRFGIN